jgi:16S rRNA pseudouridine516 synthase
MFAAVGNRVVNLHRQQIGAIKLDQSLPVGQWRYLSPKEFQAFI